MSNWTSSPYFSSATSQITGVHGNWFGLLKNLGDLTASEESSIREVGKHKIRTAGKGSRRALVVASRRLKVIEHMAARQNGGELLDFSPVTARLSQDSYNLEVSAAIPPKSITVVIRSESKEHSLANESERFRLSLGSKRSATAWDSLATQFGLIQKSLAGYLTNHLGVMHLAHLANEGRVKWPNKIISACSGDGALYKIFNEMSEHFERRGLGSPSVTDLDFSAAMLASSPNPRTIIADAGTSLDVRPGSFNGFECSCPHRVSEIDGLISNASRALSIGGVLWMKVENLFFSDQFVEGLERAGFAVIDSHNTQLQLPKEALKDLPPELLAKIDDASRKTRFLFAVKLAESGQISSEDFVFEKALAQAEEYAHIKLLLKAALSGARDSEYVKWIRDLRSAVTDLSELGFESNKRLMVGLLKHAMRVFYSDELSGTAYNGITQECIKNLRLLIEKDFVKIKRSSEDPVHTFLQELLEISEIIEFRNKENESKLS